MPRDRLVGLVFDDRYLTHNTGLDLIEDRSHYPFAEPVAHPSSPALVGRAKHLMDLFGIADRMRRIDPVCASDEQLTAYHAGYLARVIEIAQTDGGDTGSGAPIGRGGDRVARLAAGGTLAAVDAVMSGAVDAAYALVRPPGHHAMADEGMGFCVFNNVVVAARRAQRVHGVDRVLILDWDVHHGNGTQAAFWADPSVLFISLHQDDLYPPGWGAADRVGIEAGEGFTVNVPLPAGTGNRSYAEAYAKIVVPIARQFDPDLVIVSAGQDASVFDPLARMSLTLAGYRAMTEAMVTVAAECCQGRLVVTQEVAMPRNTRHIARRRCPGACRDPAGRRVDRRSVWGTSGDSARVGAVGSRRRGAIERVIAVQQRYWAI